MLYVFYGNDVPQIRARAHACAHEHVREGEAVTEVSDENYTHDMLRALAGAISLFAGREVVLIDMLSEDPEAFALLLGDAPILAASHNVFIVIEGTLLAEQRKVLAEHATEMVEVKRGEATKFNTFALADALLRRDKKSLWILLVEAMRHDVPSEEIIGTLFWQIKILRLAERTKSAEEAGQKPFVYNKAKRALSLFKQGELDRLSRDLVAIYHEGHMGKRDIAVALERLVLSL